MLLARRLFGHRGVRSAHVSASSGRNPRHVIVSECTDIYTNLALEDWFYKNWDFENQQLLLLWRNEPCVVIGRHQNPWLEANLPYLEASGIRLARRNSGGGAVYHDLGNLNCSFFTHRSDYNRDENLRLICSAISKLSSMLNTSITSRQDIVLDGRGKISGTAAKLGRNSAYHHCTILVRVDRDALRSSLRSDAAANLIDTKATTSFRMPVCNLAQVDSSLDVHALQGALAGLYSEMGVCSVRPDEQQFPGLGQIISELSSPAWIFGKTPAFKVCTKVSFRDGLDLRLEASVAQAILQRVSVWGLPEGQTVPEDVLTGLSFDVSLPDAAASRLSTSWLTSEQQTLLIACLQALVRDLM